MRFATSICEQRVAPAPLSSLPISAIYRRCHRSGSELRPHSPASQVMTREPGPGADALVHRIPSGRRAASYVIERDRRSGIHSTLITFRKPCPVWDLFGSANQWAATRYAPLRMTSPARASQRPRNGTPVSRAGVIDIGTGRATTWICRGRLSSEGKCSCECVGGPAAIINGGEAMTEANRSRLRIGRAGRSTRPRGATFG